jgi:hypothetical protein
MNDKRVKSHMLWLLVQVVFLSEPPMGNGGISATTSRPSRHPGILYVVAGNGLPLVTDHGRCWKIPTGNNVTELWERIIRAGPMTKSRDARFDRTSKALPQCVMA